jgi:hypothetical protein
LKSNEKLEVHGSFREKIISSYSRMAVKTNIKGPIIAVNDQKLKLLLVGTIKLKKRDFSCAKYS